MNITYILTISLKSLMDRKLRSFLTVLGIIIGVGSIVFLVSLGYGLERMIESQVASPNALSVFEMSLNDSDIASINDEHLSKVKNMNNVDKVEPGFILAGKTIHKSIRTDIAVYGFSKDFLDLSEMKVAEGAVFSKNNERKALASTKAIALLGISEKDFEGKGISVEIITDKNLSPVLETGNLKSLENIKISGVVKDDKNPFVIVPSKMLQEELSMTNYNTAKVRVKDKNHLQDTRKQIEKIGFSTVFIGDTVNQINTFFTSLRYVVGSFGAFAIVVAILGMLNTLTVSLVERTQEIGILKANGARRKDILRLFLSDAVIISFIGGVSGVIVGFSLGELTNFIFNSYAERSGGKAIDFFYTPVLFALGIIITAISVGVLTGLYPAKRASKIKILEAIKYE